MNDEINKLRKDKRPQSSTAVHALLDRLEAAEKERDILRDKLALESQENGALRDSVDRACEERDTLLEALKWMVLRTEEGGYPDGKCLEDARAAIALAAAPKPDS